MELLLLIFTTLSPETSTLVSGDAVMKIITNNFYKLTTPDILKALMKINSTLLINMLLRMAVLPCVNG